MQQINRKQYVKQVPVGMLDFGPSFSWQSVSHARE